MGIFSEHPQSSMSDTWYRVGGTRPRLSPHAQLTRQAFGAANVCIVEDPAAGNYYRLSESAAFFVGMLDGRRSVDEAWEACNAQLGDEAPTQRECVEILSKLQRFGLLLGEQPLAADMVRHRREESARARFQKQTGRLFSITVPLVNPERALERVAPLLRAVFSRWGMVAWCVTVLAGLWSVVPRWRELTGAFNDVLDPANLVWLTVMFLVLRAWHELGHAMACKAMGGRCTQVGVLLILLVMPLPYCDASSSWRFPEVWRRVVVSAGGMLVEVFAAALAAVVWSYSETGLVRALAYNAMVVSGVATLVFNANPLLRYDGYYILSDLTGTPNLAQRSRELWVFLIERVGFGLSNSRPPSLRGPGEAWFMGVYAALSFPYRIFITVSLLLFLLPKYLTLGAVMAACAGTAWLVWPMLKAVAYLASEPKLMGRRGRAVGVSAGALLAVAVGLGVVPFPAAGFGSGTVETVDRAVVRPDEDGFVRRVLVRVGQRVVAGEPLLMLENVELEAEVKGARARVDRARADLDEASLKSPTELEVSRRALAKAEAELTRGEARRALLVVRTPVDGTVCPSMGSGLDFAQLEGRFVARGTNLAEVRSTDRLIVRALVSDLDQAYVFRGRDPTAETPGDMVRGVHATLRVRGVASGVIPARIVRVGPAGTRKLPNGALATTVGGDIDLDPSDPKRERTLSPQFQIELEPLQSGELLLAGQRARVRLGIAPEPLLWQAWRRARQYFTARRES